MGEAAVEPEPERQGRRVSLAGIAAALAIASAAWYAIQSAVAAWIYDPLGVQPREIGLSSGALLMQATVGLVAFLLLLLVLMVVLLVMWLVVAIIRDVRKGPEAGGLDLVMGLLTAYVAVWFAAILAVVLWLVVAPFVFWHFASEARDSLKGGRRPSFVLGFPAPWRGEVAFPRPVGKPALQLPACALYLGQADGTVVLYDAVHERALRVPASAVILELEHRKKSCPTP